MLPEKVDHILHCEMKIFAKFFENGDTTPENLRNFCENLGKVDHILHREMKIFVKFFENEDTTPENLRKFCENLKK